MGLFRKSARQLAEERRVNEVMALLLKVEQTEFFDDILPWERQLLAKLQAEGITKVADLNNRRLKSRVKAGFGIPELPATQSFSEYLLNGEEPISTRVRCFDPQVHDLINSNKRLAEARVLISNLENVETYKQDLRSMREQRRLLDEIKKNQDNPEEKARLLVQFRQSLSQSPIAELSRFSRDLNDEQLLSDRVDRKLNDWIRDTVSKVTPTPVNMMLLDAMRQHGITSTEDFNDVQKCIWVIRGMPGTFVEKEIGLKPSESFGMLDYGSSRAEITENVNKMCIERMTQRFTGVFNRMGEGGEKKPLDIETAALLALHGIRSPADLATEEGKNWMLANRDHVSQGYNGDGSISVSFPVDKNGFPAIQRSADMNAMLEFYVKNQKIATTFELREFQAASVMRKVKEGAPLTQWEDALYVALAKYGVSDVTDLKNPRVQRAVKSGLPDAFPVPPQNGFGSLTIRDLHPWLVQKREEIKNSSDYAGIVPGIQRSRVPLRNNRPMDAIAFATQMDNAYGSFMAGQQLTPKQEELLACAVMHGYGSYKSFLKGVVSNPLHSPLAADGDLYDKIDFSYAPDGNFQEGQELDEQGFAANRKYDPGVKEYILKLREAQKAPAGQRVIPEYVSGMARSDRMKLMAKKLSVALPPAPNAQEPVLTKKQAENIRLQQVQALFAKCAAHQGLTADEYQLLAALQDNGITRAEDLRRSRNVRLVKAGLGLNAIGNKSFSQYIKVEGHMVDPFLNIYTDDSQKRSMEATMILEKFKDHDLLLEQLNNAKKYYHASLMLEKQDLSQEDRTHYEQVLSTCPYTDGKTGAARTKRLMKEVTDVLPLAMPTPAEMMLYETMRAHGITNAEQLADDPIKDLFVRRGMPGTFVSQQVKLRPDQAYSDLQYGLSQDEITRNKAREARETLKNLFKDSFEKIGQDDRRPFDVVRVAMLRAHGIESPEQLSAPENEEILDKNGNKLRDRLAMLFDENGNPEGSVDEGGYPVNVPLDDNTRMIVDMYRRDGKMPTKQELRLEQATKVVAKVTAGEDLKEWEQTLYAGLVKQGVKTEEDLQNPEIKTAIEQGLPAQFSKTGKSGFADLTYRSVSKAAVEEVIAFQVKNTQVKADPVNRPDIMKKFAKVMEQVDVYEQAVERPRANQHQGGNNAINPALVQRNHGNNGH